MLKNIEEILKYSKDLTLLYVEDNDDAREMTLMFLEDFFDNIIVAVDGQDGVEKFQENKIDLVLTDINMPRLNGLEMAKKIKEQNEDTPIIVVSAHNEDNFFLESIEIGINAYLLKPIDMQHLTNALFQIVQKYKYQLQAQENLHFLKTYQETVNINSIVSKADIKGNITYVNDIFCEISGYTREELLGKKHNIVRHPDNPSAIFEEMWHTISKEKKPWQGIVRNRAKDGKSYYVNSVVAPILDMHGNILEYISIRHDVTTIMNPAKQLKDAIRDCSNPILLFMKLDKFDMLKEFYDYKTVEEIEKQAMNYLQKKFEQHYKFDTFYTLENGKCAILISADKYLNPQEEFIQDLRKLQEDITNEIITFNNIVYDIAILISVVYEKNKMLDSAALGLKKLLKTNGSFIVANNLVDKEQAKAKENMEVVSMIQTALKNGNIISYFQPIVDNKTQEVAKYESLVRLIDSTGKVVSPFFFLDTAKKSNYYSQITDTVLKHSFSVLKMYGVSISINLSALDIEQKTTRENILQLLNEHKEHAHNVVFELLEDENIKEFDVIKSFITEVKSYGVKIAIDDFGAGYSNYERLLDYQPDILKIDGCLIRDIETSSYSLSVVKSIVTFAKEQNIQTVAEFIENESIFNIVRELGVDFSQGYYFNKPEPITHYID